MSNLINKLVLGTVQFGLNYGINNPDGKPLKSQSLAILDLAYKQGVRIFDTANAYGEAEEILGEFMEKRDLKDKVQIITKLKPNIINTAHESSYNIILDNLTVSLTRLKREYVDAYLFHSPTYIKDKRLVKHLCRIKSNGLIKNMGVSIYDEEDALYAVNLKEVDYIQIPYNILDQRLSKTSFFDIAKKNSKTIFARSTFLQGLLLMPEHTIPSHLNDVKKYLNELDEVIGKYNLSRVQAALLFSIQNKHIDYVVFGVDNINQLEELIEIVKANNDCQDFIEEIKNKFINIEKHLICPSLWKA